MPEELRDFNWSTTSSDGLLPDTLDRAKYASFLHNYLVSATKNEGYVLNLNASWGAGKTYFIKRWVDSIKDVHPVVYIDAWKQDYSDDPMLTVVSSLIDALREQLPPENKSIDNIARKSARFLKTAAPILTRALVKKATGIDTHAFPNQEDAPESQNFDHAEEGDSSEVMSKSAAKLAECLIYEHNEKLHSIHHLRREIKGLVTAVLAHKDKLQSPAFIFIDELDRCRPSYAVEMLEVVKHFFEIENIIFVISTDTEQLQYAVKAVYGEGFDAQTYLGRFFRRRYSLTSPSRYEFLSQIINDRVSIRSKWKNYVPSITDTNDITFMVSRVCDCFDLSLRDCEQLTEKFIAVSIVAEKCFNPYLLLILLVLKDKDYPLYAEWISDGESFLPRGVERHQLLKGSFPFYWNSNQEVYSPYANGGNRVAVGHTLCHMLEMMSSPASPQSYQKRSEAKERLRTNIHRASNQEDQIRYKFNLSIWSLSATKTDYENWVELSVSFDN